MTASVIIGIVGLVMAFAILVWLCYKGWDLILVSFICALVVILTNAFNWETIQAARQTAMDALVASGGTDAAIAAAAPFKAGLTGFFGGYVWDMLSKFGGGVGSFATGYFLMFIFGSLFGQVMGDSGAAKSVAVRLSKWFGAKNAIIVVAIAAGLLTYGGINVFIVIFAVYPLAVVLFKQADLPKKLLAGAVALGGGTFTLTAMPGSPSLTNIIPTRFLGTTAYAAWWLGLIASAIMFVLGIIYLNAQGKKLKASGEHFVPGANDQNMEAAIDESKLPAFGTSIIPILIVIVVIMALSLAPGTKTAIPATFTVVIGLILSIVVCILLNLKRYESLLKTINSGIRAGLIPLLGIASIVGFGTVVSNTVAFQAFVRMITTLQANPYITTGIGVNVLAAITGSSSSSVQLFLQLMGQTFVEKGANPEVIHRLGSIAGGCLDSLPHSSAVVTMLLVMGVSHKEGYKYVGMITVVFPFVALIVCTAIAIFAFPI